MIGLGDHCQALSTETCTASSIGDTQCSEEFPVGIRNI